ncbi:MAG TPA: O-antigen ligase family protein [Pyrinomonadaceae bacterium]|nr:O-antigen ligase family protein [Pyrinomonadaceae bacterium]
MIETENSIEKVGPDGSRFASAILFTLCFIVIFSTLTFGAVDPATFSVLAVITALVIVFWAIDSWRQRGLRFSGSRLQLPVLGLIVLGLIQLLPLRGSDIPSGLLSIPAAATLSLDPYSTRLFLIRLIICFVFFAAALTFIDSRKRLQKVVLTIIIFGAALAFFGILQRLADPDSIYGIRNSPQSLTFGPFGNQHHFAALMEMTGGLTLGLLFGRDTSREHKFLLMIAALLMGIALALTSSRGGMISFAGVIMFLAAANFLPERRGRRRDGSEKRTDFKRLLVLSAASVGLVLLIFGGVLFLGGDQSLLRGIGLTGQADVTSGRSHFWAVALQIFLAHPIIGAGLEAFGAAYTQFDSQSGLFRVEQAHNDYLQTLADAGILGFICVASFVYLLFKESLERIGNAKDGFSKNAALGALAGCFGILIHSFFDFPLRTPSNAFVFLMLVAIATVSIHRDHKSSELVREQRDRLAA